MSEANNKAISKEIVTLIDNSITDTSDAGKSLSTQEAAIIYSKYESLKKGTWYITRKELSILAESLSIHKNASLGKVISALRNKAHVTSIEKTSTPETTMEDIQSTWNVDTKKQENITEISSQSVVLPESKWDTSSIDEKPQETQKPIPKTAILTYTTINPKDVPVNASELDSSDPQVQFAAKLRYLSDFDGWWFFGNAKVESESNLFGGQKNIIGEGQIYNIMQDIIKTDEDLSLLLKRFHITTEDWSSKKSRIYLHDTFRDNLMKKASTYATWWSMLFGDRGARAWLYAVLQGTEKEYIQAIMSNPTVIERAKQIAKDGTPTEKKSLLAMIGSIGVGIVNPLRLAIETRNPGVKIEKDKNGNDIIVVDAQNPISKNFGTWEANVEFLFRFVEIAAQANFGDKENDIKNKTRDYITSLESLIPAGEKIDMSKVPTDISESAQDYMNMYNDAFDMVADKKNYRNALIVALGESFLLDLAKQKKGFSIKWLEIGLHMFTIPYIGVNIMNVGTFINAVQQKTLATDVEWGSTKKLAKMTDIIGLSEVVDREKQIWTYTFSEPFPNIITPDMEWLNATIVDGKIVIVSDTPLIFNQSTNYLTEGSKQVTLTIQKPEKTSLATEVGTKKSSLSEENEDIRYIKTIRDIILSEKPLLPGSLYYASRHKLGEWQDAKKFARYHASFDQLFKLIGDQQYDSAYDLLGTMQKYGPAKDILSTIEKYKDTISIKDILVAVNTFTYGGKERTNTEGISLNGYTADRRSDIIRAEDALDVNSINHNAEIFFRTKPIHKAQSLSSLLGGKNALIDIFATPQNAIHKSDRSNDRIDKMEGSIQVSDSLFIDGQNGNIMSDAQKISIISHHTNEITIRFNQLNNRLNALQKKRPDLQVQLLDPTEYNNMLLTGNIDPKLQKLGFKIEDPAQFFEARAMITGSVCVNKCQGMTHMTFIWDPQDPPPVELDQVTISGSAPVASEKARITILDPYAWLKSANTNGVGNLNTTASNPTNGLGGGANAIPGKV